ncbi:MAG: hypothetical protein FJY82_06075 [Candidatus Aminicenantes bacterium]|nr:hypothetical protein [Candidatus Aminicenantes bacterium]
MKRLLAGLLLLAAAGPGYGQTDQILKLKDQIVRLQNEGDLGFGRFSLCSEILGFGSYAPLPQAVIPRNGILLVYYEPANVFTAVREGLYEIWYTQDLALLDAGGKVIQEWKDFLTFRQAAKQPILDLYAKNTLELQGLPPGDYKLRAVLKDRFRKGEAVKVVDFAVK